MALCRRTLAAFDAEKEVYMLKVVDLSYTITPSTRTIAPESGSSSLSWDTRLLILAYLTGATETLPSGKWTSPVEFSGGELFFSADAHNLKFNDLKQALKSPEHFLTAGKRVAGKEERIGIGSSSFVLQALPKIPLLFIYWEGDAELPSKISVLVDETARSHLAIDGLWLAIRVSEKRLIQVAA